MAQNSDLSDIALDDWVSRWLPESWQPYARLCRLDRPIGTWLTVIPTCAALVLAACGIPETGRLIVFCLGALLMRSAGCTINDIWDRDFDRHVERTRYRPLTSGQISLSNAVIFLIAQLVVAGLLLFFINAYSRWMALAVLPLTIIYPLCKRFTNWPQLVLGMAFNWGMLMAWTDTQDRLPAEAALMWLGAVFWQLGYDTMYAYADMEDDRKVGIKSTAGLFGEKGLWWLSAFYALTVLLWAIAGAMVGVHWSYWFGMAAIAVLFVQQLRRFDVRQRQQSFRMFRQNIWCGILLLAAALAGTLL